MVEATDLPEQPDDDGMLPAGGIADQSMDGDNAYGSDAMDDALGGLMVIEEMDELP